MQDAPPPIIMTLPDRPGGFSIEDLQKDEPLDLLRLRSCTSFDPDEIVVCGRRDPDRHRLGPLLPDAPTAMEEVSNALTRRIGSAEIRPGTIQGAHGPAIGITIRLGF